MSMENFKIKQFDDITDTTPSEAVTYDYPSDCLDFVPIKLNTTTKYMAVARDSEAVPINVWVAEPTRRTIIEDAPETVSTGRIIPVMAG